MGASSNGVGSAAAGVMTAISQVSSEHTLPQRYGHSASFHNRRVPSPLAVTSSGAVGETANENTTGSSVPIVFVLAQFAVSTEISFETPCVVTATMTPLR